MRTKPKIQELENNEDLELLERGDKVRTNEFGCMEYHYMDEKGNVLFIGRGKGEIESIVFVTINKDNISIENSSLSFNQYYEIEKRFNRGEGKQFYKEMDHMLKKLEIFK